MSRSRGWSRNGRGFAASLSVGLACAAAACSSGDANNAANPGNPEATSDAAVVLDATSSDAAISADATTSSDECAVGEAYCSGARTTRACTATAAGLHWQDHTCAAGQGCVQGACTPNACSDECAAGDSQSGKTCALYDIAHDSWGALDATASLHDRARAYAAYLRKSEMVYGGVGSAHFSDAPAYATTDTMNGLGDSALWTGTYLASEALRSIATGSADAHAEVLSVVKTLDLFFHVSGEPATLARFVRLAGQNPGFSLPDVNCASTTTVHCGVPLSGKLYDYVGHISRDQYQGFMLGMTLAYEALTSDDEPTRAIIRADIVALVKELMTDRTVPATVTYQGVPIPLTLTMRFVVLNHAEMTSGRVQVNLDSSDANGTGMFGLQEFTPDLADIVHQLPGLGFAPSIPRSSSAMMLASFFRDALRVTDVPSAAADHAAILDYYLHHTGIGGNVDAWLSIAKQWSASNDCGDGYYANNIAMMPMYDLAQLEDDPARSSLIQNQILGGPMWTAFAKTKNSFFSFITAANVPSLTPSVAAVTSSAMTQLAQFPAPPRVMHAVDQTSNAAYLPHSTSCTNQVDHSNAVDVGDRIVADFMWQRQPWGLLDSGDVGQTEPGVDYLIAYWMARRHAFTSDDDPTQCLAWH